ncbi:MAG TPA: hypothetical protein VGI45_14205 [Terracidiphilus sp.]
MPAFIPAAVCTGYLVAWFTDLHGFRQRSFIERIFWSIPLSFAVSTISSVLIGKFTSLTAVAVFYILAAIVWLVTIAAEALSFRRINISLRIGFKPLGAIGLLFALIWIILAIMSLIDFQCGERLYSTLFLWDHASRINWTQSVLRTGIPPANSLYFYQHIAPMRNYYFWYVLCAAIAKLFHLPARAVVTASCVWGGFGLASIVGLYLKYVLNAGARLRRQFLLAIALLGVTGLDIVVNIVEIFFMHRSLPLDLEWWSHDEIFSWYGSLLWVPHHMTALVCCMFALLLAWLSKPEKLHVRITEVVVIGAALASAFGLSVFVPFGFFLVMIVWTVWQTAIERAPRPVIQMALGGVFSLILLAPYLSELMHNSAATSGGALAAVGVGDLVRAPSATQTTSLFGFAVREMIPANALLRLSCVSHFSHAYPNAARTLARLILLLPGYAIELGFYAVVFLIYLVPSFRSNRRLTAPERLLVFLALAILPFITFIRSTVLASNDFGWRAALLLQFPLLLLASDLLMGWKPASPSGAGLTPTPTPRQKSIRSLARLALVIGIVSTVSQALLLRFDDPLLEFGFRAKHSPRAGIVAHNAYISYIGYAKLNRLAPPDAIVQFNPDDPWDVWKSFDFINVNHPIAVSFNQLWCGAPLGGDPSGCPGMLAAIDPLFQGAPAEHARTVCRQYGIHYLIAKIYDPAWSDKSSWVWTLPPAVSDPDFRALDCQ